MEFIEPHIIQHDPELLIYTAPIERWNYDILSPNGYESLMSIFNYIKGECMICY